MDIINITEEKWDILVILDACRYDYFEKNYRQFFDKGSLKLRQTVGTSTVEWRDKSFPARYDDIIYISANPNIADNANVYGYTGNEHFAKVYEIWKTHWDKYRGTVLPETMTAASLEIIKKHSGKRFVLHYLQPHEPYLMPSISSAGYDQADINSNRKLIGFNYNSRSFKLRMKLLNAMMKHRGVLKKFTGRPEWILRQILCLPPRCAMDAVRRKYGTKILKQAYEMNLRYALEQIAVFIRNVSGKVVITSDHGEFLGEEGNYAHPENSNNSILRNVPWFEIESGQAADENGTNKDDSLEVKEKLQALGYVD